MLDVGCWMLDVGCWMLDVGCSMLDVRCWMFDVGCSMLDVRCWKFGSPPERGQGWIIRSFNASTHAIQRTPHSNPRLPHHMRVNLRRAHIFVSEQFLDGSDIV